MATGIIVFESGKGWWIVEVDGTSEGVFVHHSQVADHRYLHLNDRIEFSITPNPKRPGQNEARNARYIGHVIVRQTSGAGGVR
jgi:cold shock CspA family protein